MNSIKLINMESDVAEKQIAWLWYPFIPFGKITMIQGDPGDGKTSLALAIAAAVTTGQPLPECKNTVPPSNVIFQTAEDGLGDTVKPRLKNAGADCSKVNVIDESETALSLSDERIEAAILSTNAKLFIIDPLQAYLGAGVDMHRANEIRPILKRISVTAEKTGCAVVMIGHLNKGVNKSQYRGLGSIDFQAVARSVLTVGRPKNPTNNALRVFVQGKSNLAPDGGAIAFELNEGFRWVGKHGITIDELLGGFALERETPYTKAIAFLQTELAEGERLSSVLIDKAATQSISKRTLDRAKEILSVKSVKRGEKWYWSAK